MRIWEISSRINSPKDDDPSLWDSTIGLSALSQARV